MGIKQLLRYVNLLLYLLESVPRIQKFSPIKFPAIMLGCVLPINPIVTGLQLAILAKGCGAGACWCPITPFGANIGAATCMGWYAGMLGKAGGCWTGCVTALACQVGMRGTF